MSERPAGSSRYRQRKDHMSHRFRHSHGAILVALSVLLAVLAGCASSPEAATVDPTPTATGDATATPASEPPATATATQATESPAASPSASPSAASLVIPSEIPCDAIDLATVEGIIGGEIATEREWEPGDQPFGDSVPPSINYGCQYVVEGPQGSVPEFGLTVLGRDLSEAEWEEIFASQTDCRDAEASVDLAGDVVAEVCASGVEGFSNVTLRGLFGSTGVVCGAYLPDELVDAALQAAAIGECARIIAELAS